jgi:hypothetical protein
MSTDGRELFDALAPLQIAAELEPTAESGLIFTGALVARWLANGPTICTGDDREQLDALCRQIDVRKRVSAGYAAGWKRLDPEEPAEPAVVSGLVAVLLANAAGVGAPGPDGSRNDGWGLKCTNSALKALALREQAPYASDLRSWAVEVLDRMRELEEHS